MSAENVATVRTAYESFGRGDIPAVLATLDPQVEWVETEAAGIPTRGTHRGPDGVLQGVIGAVPANFDEFVLAPEHYLDAGDKTVVTGRVRAKVKATGKSFDAPFAHVFTVSGGKIVHMMNYHDTAVWLQAFQP